jgi:hypothetical protein
VKSDDTSNLFDAELEQLRTSDPGAYAARMSEKKSS